MDADSVAEESPRDQSAANQSHELDVERGQDKAGGYSDEQAEAAVVMLSDCVRTQASRDRRVKTDSDETAKKRKKDRKYLQQNAASSAGPGPGPGTGTGPVKSLLNRTMSEWQQTCSQLRLPTESQQFCDFVLVFDEIEDDINEAKNRTGCCSCCQKSPKELQKCVQV